VRPAVSRDRCGAKPERCPLNECRKDRQNTLMKTFFFKFGLCGGCSACLYCSNLQAGDNVQRRQSILKPSQPCDLVVKPLAELHNVISAYWLPADRESLLPTSDAPTRRGIFGTLSADTLASKADGKDVIKFHGSAVIRSSRRQHHRKWDILQPC
jgi:hypothetical protein